MKNNPIWYRIEGDDDRLMIMSEWAACAVDSTDCREWAAEDCARDYYSEHDGMHCDWPIEITLYADNEDGSAALGVYSIEMEHEPHFRANEVMS